MELYGCCGVNAENAAAAVASAEEFLLVSDEKRGGMAKVLPDYELCCEVFMSRTSIRNGLRDDI